MAEMDVSAEGEGQPSAFNPQLNGDVKTTKRVARVEGDILSENTLRGHQEKSEIDVGRSFPNSPIQKQEGAAPTLLNGSVKNHVDETPRVVHINDSKPVEKTIKEEEWEIVEEPQPQENIVMR